MVEKQQRLENLVHKVFKRTLIIGHIQLDCSISQFNLSIQHAIKRD